MLKAVGVLHHHHDHLLPSLVTSSPLQKPPLPLVQRALSAVINICKPSRAPRCCELCSKGRQLLHQHHRSRLHALLPAPDLPKGMKSVGRKTPQSLRRHGAMYL